MILGCEQHLENVLLHIILLKKLDLNTSCMFTLCLLGYLNFHFNYHI